MQGSDSDPSDIQYLLKQEADAFTHWATQTGYPQVSRSNLYFSASYRRLATAAQRPMVSHCQATVVKPSNIPTLPSWS